MKNRIASIICGAPCAEFPPKRFSDMIEGLVIAADKGLDYCLAAGITPDAAVGDFDSARESVPQGVECIRVSPIKDDTDMSLAAETAIKKGCDILRFFCALGGRISHSCANFQMLKKFLKNGISACLYGDNTEVFALENSTVKIPRFDGYLSIFSFGESAEASASGVKYPMSSRVLTNDFPLGVSNEITDRYAEITAHNGILLIIKEYN